MDQIIALLEKLRVIPVISIDDPDKALPLADALIEGGLPLAEITFRTEAATKAIEILGKQRPELNVCAGTILTIDHLKKAKDYGARFGVAPGFDPKMVEEAFKINFPFIPGVLTPSEVTMAINYGLTLLKFFPSEPAGGIKLLKSIIAPFAHLGIKYSPTGGIGKDSYLDYLEIPQVISVGGSWIASKEDIGEGNWEQIKSNCLEITGQ
ncbi:MAG: bifunctional 4-hydroxy-2-oxoglutarate aldolase/2-dehydro-3-deoxy-phosphogluconate aldolase [Bacteroidales bacterium]|nr:bifunctional 4-hydroxy-2-oxoglutarate aldolase/2-dehydro-3-deoxy-phosphogluconate aldolase [Bacteroidales bacterium]